MGFRKTLGCCTGPPFAGRFSLPQTSPRAARFDKWFFSPWWFLIVPRPSGAGLKRKHKPMAIFRSWACGWHTLCPTGQPNYRPLPPKSWGVWTSAANGNTIFGTYRGHGRARLGTLKKNYSSWIKIGTSRGLGNPAGLADRCGELYLLRPIETLAAGSKGPSVFGARVYRNPKSDGFGSRWTATHPTMFWHPAIWVSTWESVSAEIQFYRGWRGLTKRPLESRRAPIRDSPKGHAGSLVLSTIGQ